MNDLYFIYELNKQFNFEELKELLMINEVDCLRNNIYDLLNDKETLERQTDYIKNIVNMDLNTIIFELENQWSYAIEKIIEKEYTIEIEVKASASVEQVNELLNNIQKDYSKNYIKVINQNYNCVCNSLSFKIFLKTTNIYIEELETFLDNQAIVLEYKQ